MALVKTQPLTINSSSVSGSAPDEFNADCIICKDPAKLVAVLASAVNEKAIHFVSDGDWSTADLVMLLLQKFQPADLFFTTYAIRETQVRQLVLAKERGELSSISMLIDYRANVRTPEAFQLAAMNATAIYLTAIHAKVCVIKTADACITINGSSNWTTNPRIESGVITLNANVGAFHIDWIKKVMQNAEIFK